MLKTFKAMIRIYIRLVVWQGLMLNYVSSSTRDSYSITCYVGAFSLDKTFKTMIRIYIRLAVGQGLM